MRPAKHTTTSRSGSAEGRRTLALVAGLVLFGAGLAYGLARQRHTSRRAAARPVSWRRAEPLRDRPLPVAGRPPDWTIVDEASDESFPASDPPAY